MDGSCGKVIEEEADEVEDRGGFENDGEFSGLELRGILSPLSLFAGGFCQTKRVKTADIGGVGFGPACGRAVLHGHRKRRVSLAIRGQEPARIAQDGLVLSTGKDAGSHLAFAFREVASLLNRAGSFIGGKVSRDR